ncbi:MAG: hypothetical protein O7H41_03735 [Planctomycetota bacterium]|nr:hypothetical protein [Planctomycetota bacterium]
MADDTNKVRRHGFRFAPLLPYPLARRTKLVLLLCVLLILAVVAIASHAVLFSTPLGIHASLFMAICMFWLALGRLEGSSILRTILWMGGATVLLVYPEVEKRLGWGITIIIIAFCLGAVLTYSRDFLRLLNRLAVGTDAPRVYTFFIVIALLLSAVSSIVVGGRRYADLLEGITHWIRNLSPELFGSLNVSSEYLLQRVIDLLVQYGPAVGVTTTRDQVLEFLQVLVLHAEQLEAIRIVLVVIFASTVLLKGLAHEYNTFRIRRFFTAGPIATKGAPWLTAAFGEIYNAVVQPAAFLLVNVPASIIVWIVRVVRCAWVEFVVAFSRALKLVGWSFRHIALPAIIGLLFASILAAATTISLMHLSSPTWSSFLLSTAMVFLAFILPVASILIASPYKWAQLYQSLRIGDNSADLLILEVVKTGSVFLICLPIIGGILAFLGSAFGDLPFEFGPGAVFGCIIIGVALAFALAWKLLGRPEEEGAAILSLSERDYVVYRFWKGGLLTRGWDHLLDELCWRARARNAKPDEVDALEESLYALGLSIEPVLRVAEAGYVRRIKRELRRLRNHPTSALVQYADEQVVKVRRLSSKVTS